MAKTAMITARVDPDRKADAEKVLNKLGISTTEAINLFLSQVRLRRGLPFDVKIPNKTTRKAMKDAEEDRNLSSYDSIDTFFKKMSA
ncbi:MAG: type II toxin-antitoxin system RelB/DinJ family antitoxin [Candidatus Atribacteria bacterium]|nr:MAG: type II toxin-antitoxin system RelB/DinJ family antitoxin [Candidatus Atribacteria bacterium]